jgi:hypothetical protein
MKSMSLSGLFGLAIKQYHKKSILFHFYLIYFWDKNYPRPSRSDFVLLLVWHNIGVAENHYLETSDQWGRQLPGARPPFLQ